MMLGWMIIATLPDGRAVAMPTSPEVLDALPVHLHGTLPTLGGVWKEEGKAMAAWGKIPEELRGRFKVVPVAITILGRDL